MHACELRQRVNEDKPTKSLGGGMPRFQQCSPCMQFPHGRLRTHICAHRTAGATVVWYGITAAAVVVAMHRFHRCHATAAAAAAAREYEQGAPAPTRLASGATTEVIFQAVMSHMKHYDNSGKFFWHFSRVSAHFGHTLSN